MDVREVARIGYEGMKQGKRIVIPGWKNRVGVEMLRISPRAMVTKVVRRLQEKKNELQLTLGLLIRRATVD